MATVREKAKAAVDRAKRDAASMWVTLQFNSTTPVEYEPGNPSAKGAEVSSDVLALEGQYSVFEPNNVQGIQSGDRRFYIDPDDIDDISIVDSVTFQGKKHQIVNYSLIQQDVLLEVQLRHGG